jgi:polysaccharide pyruvyl transferase WcaK-like protein
MTIAIGPIPYFDPRVWPQKNQATYDTYVAKLVEFSAWVVRRGFRVRFVPGSLSQDRAVIADVMGRLRRAPYTVCEDHASEANVGDVDSLLNELRSCAIVISSRFHGVVLAAVVHRPIIALTHHPKIDALMRNMGQQTFCADISTFTVDSLKTMFLASIGARDQIASTLREYVASRMPLLDEQYDRVFCEQASAGA